MNLLCLKASLFETKRSLSLFSGKGKWSIISSVRLDRSSPFEPPQKRDTFDALPSEFRWIQRTLTTCSVACVVEGEGLTADDLDNLLPDGWSERAFRTTNRCVVSPQQPIIIRFANQRKLHYDHSNCPRCGLHQKGCRNPCTVIIAQ